MTLGHLLPAARVRAPTTGRESKHGRDTTMVRTHGSEFHPWALPPVLVFEADAGCAPRITRTGHRLRGTRLGAARASRERARSALVDSHANVWIRVASGLVCYLFESSVGAFERAHRGAKVAFGFGWRLVKLHQQKASSPARGLDRITSRLRQPESRALHGAAALLALASPSWLVTAAPSRLLHAIRRIHRTRSCHLRSSGGSASRRGTLTSPSSRGMRPARRLAPGETPRVPTSPPSPGGSRRIRGRQALTG